MTVRICRRDLVHGREDEVLAMFEEDVGSQGKASLPLGSVIGLVDVG